MTSEVRFIVKFRVPPHIIFEAITNEEMISKYTQAKAKFEKKMKIITNHSQIFDIFQTFIHHWSFFIV